MRSRKLRIRNSGLYILYTLHCCPAGEEGGGGGGGAAARGREKGAAFTQFQEIL